MKRYNYQRKTAHTELQAADVQGQLAAWREVMALASTNIALASTNIARLLEEHNAAVMKRESDPEVLRMNADLALAERENQRRLAERVRR